MFCAQKGTSDLIFRGSLIIILVSVTIRDHLADKKEWERLAGMGADGHALFDPEIAVRMLLFLYPINHPEA